MYVGELRLLVAIGKIADSHLIPSTQVIPTDIPLKFVSIEYTVPGLENKASPPLQIRQLRVWPEALMIKRKQNLSSHANINQTSAEISTAKADSHNTNCQLPSPVSEIAPTVKEDGIFNYGLHVIQLGTLLMQLNDTEKEGDGERSLRNWKLLMLYFRSRSRSMKYAYEIMRFISFTKALYSEKVASRAINGQFVSLKGGAGGNVANDLKQEHIVQCNKRILKGLCGNKTLKAIQTGSSAAFGLQVTVDNFDAVSGIHKESTAHTHASRQDDEKEMIKNLSTLQPFSHKEGRCHSAFQKITKSPLDKLNIVALTEWLNYHKKRLSLNRHAELAMRNEEQESSEDENTDVSDVETEDM